MPKQYDAARGGHAPDHLRDALVQCIEDPTPGPWYLALEDENLLPCCRPDLWCIMKSHDRGWWLTGQLWNCTDVLPGTNCDNLGLPRGSTYAVAARKLRDELLRKLTNVRSVRF